MSTREDRLLAGKQLFAKVLQADVKALFDRTKEELEARLDADESFAAELPDGTRIGSVKRSKVRRTASVTDPTALLAWVKANRPEELVLSVNPAFVAALKDQARKHDKAFDPETGEVIPGVEMIDGEPSFLTPVDSTMIPVIQRKLAELIAGGLLELPASSNGDAA